MTDERFIGRENSKKRPVDWSGFIAAAEAAQNEPLILDRDLSQRQRDPFSDWAE